jgi:hypothetical protein
MAKNKPEKVVDEDGYLPSGEWQTEDLDKIRLTAGRLDEKGVIIIPQTMETKDGKNGPFRIVRGTQGGKDADLVFSSEKLSKIFDAHWDEMMGKEVLISGHGLGFERQYHVQMVQKKV